MSAKALYSAFATEKIYFYVGTDDPWINSTTPPSLTSANDIVSFKRSVWDNMAGATLVTQDRVSLGIDRNDWTSGVIYEKYDHANTSLGTGNGFFVLAGVGNRDVYKCLDNNGGSGSSIKPTNKDAGISKESDGYIWKYMYTIAESDFSDFATSSYLPVPSVDNSNKQREDGAVLNVTLPVIGTATLGIGESYTGTGFSNGTVGVEISDKRFKFTGLDGSIDIGSTSPQTTFALFSNPGLSTTDDYYNNAAFYITSGTSTGTLREIYDYTGSTGVITLNTGITGIANGDNYIIGPKVTINDSKIGSGFVGVAEVNAYGNVTNIIVASSGLNYVNAAMEVVIGSVGAAPGATPKGTGAYANVYITPMNGHGQNLTEELNAKYVIVSPETTIADSANYENGIFVGPSGTIRQTGLLLNPRTQTDSTAYDQRTTLYFENTPSNFSYANWAGNKTITNANTGSTAKIWSIDGAFLSHYLTVTNISGEFSEGDWIYSGDQYLKISQKGISKFKYPSGSTQTPFTSIMYSGMTKYSGEIIYHESVFDIPRTNGQKENFKFVFSV